MSISLPCVAGPYTTIACTLRLLKSSIRIATGDGANGYPRNTDDRGLPIDDPRFVESNVTTKAIAASSAQNDSGIFELNFRDDRYLPFEGAGAISDWSIELFTDSSKPDFGRPLRQLDHSTIQDAVLHVKLTAREDAGTFKKGAIDHLRDYFAGANGSPAALMLNLRRDFPTEWSRFQNPLKPADGNVFGLDVSTDLFPTKDAGKTLQVDRISLFARGSAVGSYKIVVSPPLPAPPPAAPATFTLPPQGVYGGLHFDSADVSANGVQITDAATTWKLAMTRPGGANLNAGEVTDLIMVLEYKWA